MFLEKYQLYLEWDSVNFINDSEVLLINPKFFGPALKIAEKMSGNDFIRLDITNQYQGVIGTWEIVELYWFNILKQTPIEVVIDKALLKFSKMMDVKSISDRDVLLIDTSNHEEKVHAFNFVYKAALLKSDNSIYSFEEQ